MGTFLDMYYASNIRVLDNARSIRSEAIQSQYSASERMLGVMASMQKRLSPTLVRSDENGNALPGTADVDIFYNNIFNLLTARGVGLDEWGRILVMSRSIPLLDGSGSITLGDDDYRLLLLYKAMANIGASTAEAQNSLLAMLVATGIGAFPRAAYVLEVDTMVIRWVFEDFLDPLQLAVFKVAGTLARGAGVGWELYAVNPGAVFGFDGGGRQPFNQAPFTPDAALIIHRG
jgi:hypothetical protein